MFDIGWPELLVIAIVLIIVVGPKDLPPMLRAFGRTTKKLRGMANEFRGQFDEALREAELDDVKKTLDDARKLNPMQTIRDAVNPLKDSAKSIRSDLEKSVNAPPAAPAWQPKTEIPDATMKLPDSPPEIKSTEAAPAASGAGAKPPAKAGSASAGKDAKPAAEPKAAAKASASKAKPASVKAPAAASKPASVAKPAAPAAKAPPAKAAAAKPASKPKAAAADSAAASPAKPAPRARKPKQGEGQA
ncbi:hypothetical protein LL06_06435 [Hoeflea sp. BAL378]|uniref:Sec-independent protein translocase protein TatB n=1 Tax=Hoeflea sp. BAL378 TaxID=1547437 RepID=UPI0005148798|nr:Sec-independent protein translocase protein TatB [Hoeflea sp. BAL378]KGF70261.1 hypothetical protein LL06_06435 [Hoeflea sp. BAL378]